MIAALLIFAGTYLVLSIGHMPGFRVDRTGAAIIGAGLMIAFGVLTMDEAIRTVNFETLILLFGMMIVVANLRLDNTGVLTFWSAVLSNLVSNVPAVLVFKPVISQLPHPDHAWLTLAMSSTLAGNLTVLGSIANIIVIERSRRMVSISFLEYLKVGVPLTVLSLLFGVLFLGPR